MSQFSQNESLALKLQHFHKMQNAVLILSQDTKELSFHFSFYRSHTCFALSVSHALFLCPSLFYSGTPSIQLNLSPLSLFSPSYLFSLFPFYLSLISFLFSHTQLDSTHFISLPLSHSLYFSFSLSISLFLFLRPTHSLDPTHFMSTIRKQLAHNNIITENNK